MTPDQERRLDELEAAAAARLRALVGSPAGTAGPRPSGASPDRPAAAADATPVTDLGDVRATPARPPARWARRLAVAAAVMVVAGGALLVRNRDRDPGATPADGDRVVAEARDCGLLTVTAGGWNFRNDPPHRPPGDAIGAPIDAEPPPAGTGTTNVDRPASVDDPFAGWRYPARWFGDDIPGRIYLDGPLEGSTQGGREARFVADDGTVIAMSGHPPGAEVFHTLACAVGGEPSSAVRDRYAELAATGPLPPVVGPRDGLPEGYRYAGMRATGTGPDRSVLLRFERAARTTPPDVGMCAASPATVGSDTPDDDRCGVPEDRPARSIVVCTTDGDGCRPGRGETRTPVRVSPAVAATTYVIGPAADAADWAEWAAVAYTGDLSGLGWSA